MASAADVKRYRTNLQEEVDSAAVYRSMAAAEGDPHLATVYRRLAEVEERHATMWEAQLRQVGVTPPGRRPSARSRTLMWLARRFGARFLLPTVANMEAISRHVYDRQADATKKMRGQERSHARLLQLIAGQTGIEGSTLARIEGRHRAVGGNALRAAVLGANDGLVSNLSLVMGVAGAALSEHAILVTGCAGLLAGACSMAMGEWISVQSSRELYERQVGVEEAEIAALPDEEKEELALIYMAKGLPEDEAKQVADRIMSDEKTALEAMSREELGIDPQELGGSPWTAAGSSFLLFALGAIVPVLPFAVAHGRAAVAVSLAASAAALLLIGFAITLFTGRGALYTGVRQLLFGLGAAALTFGIGRLVGVSGGAP
ncbi:MAG TPA: VIT1/CCC1 transporter family protein [Polyangiaceae bacterium]|nr:VIT1/CCC1 transporter family protein [Polyangiaceae bacterium]